MPDTMLMNRDAELYAGEAIRQPQFKAITLAQWMLESGRMTSELARQHYNFGGLKYRPEMAPYATRVMYNAHDGLDAYCKFATPENFISGYWAFIARAPYSGWEMRADSAEEYMRFIGGIYTPSAGYADKVLALEAEAAALLAKFASGKVKASSSGTTDIGTIVLDPGHGGTQKVEGSSPNNATSVSGVKEKKLALDFCMILRDLLIQKAGAANLKINVVLTRTADVNLGLKARAGFAKTHKAKALLCLHFNGDGRPETSGAETYHADAAHGNQNLTEDKAFAGAVHAAWVKGMRRFHPQAKDRGLKPESVSGPGGLTILTDANLGNTAARRCVGAYVEGEFITNPTIDNLLISGPDAVPNRHLLLGSVADALIAHMRAS